MIIDIIAGLLSGLLGALGFGGGGILILYLTLYRNMSQLNAQGINLLFFIPIAIFALIIHNKNKIIDWKLAIRFIICGLVGVAIGYILIINIDEGLIRKIFAFILIFAGIKDLIIKKKST